MRKLLLFIVFSVFAPSFAHAKAFTCYPQKDWTAGVWRYMTGICKGGYKVRIKGPAVGAKYGTGLYAVRCSSANPEGKYYGLSVDFAFAFGFTGGAFVGANGGCLVGALDEHNIYLDVAIPELKISAPTPESIEEAKKHIL